MSRDMEDVALNTRFAVPPTTHCAEPQPQHYPAGMKQPSSLQVHGGDGASVRDYWNVYVTSTLHRREYAGTLHGSSEEILREMADDGYDADQVLLIPVREDQDGTES